MSDDLRKFFKVAEDQQTLKERNNMLEKLLFEVIEKLQPFKKAFDVSKSIAEDKHISSKFSDAQRLSIALRAGTDVLSYADLSVLNDLYAQARIDYAENYRNDAVSAKPSED